MHQILCASNLRKIAAAALAAAGGWLAFNSSILNEYGPVQLSMAGVALLVMAWRLGASTRLSAWTVLFAWHLGAGSAMPSGWSAFFGNEMGWFAWVIWSAVAASPALLFPARLAPYALAASSLIAALTPIGILNPINAAFAFFPGMAWGGLVLAIGVLLLPSIEDKRIFVVTGLIAIVSGAFLNGRFAPPALPEDAHAMETYEGRHPSLAIEWFGRQGRISKAVIADLESGARLIVTPEGTVDKWDMWAEAVWRHAKTAAQKTGGMVLVGVYRETPDGWQDGLLDLGSGKFYGASVSMPISMWAPWREEHYPIDLRRLPDVIETPVGDAAYVACFEELLVWPLAVKIAAGDPAFLISVANQWFTKSTTSEAQTRSIVLQARLWGMPLLRAVNWPAL